MPPFEYWWIKGKSEFDLSGGWMFCVVCVVCCVMGLMFLMIL
jgi:hypothetical protein